MTLKRHRSNARFIQVKEIRYYANVNADNITKRIDCKHRMDLQEVSSYSEAYDPEEYDENSENLSSATTVFFKNGMVMTIDCNYKTFDKYFIDYQKTESFYIPNNLKGNN